MFRTTVAGQYKFRISSDDQSQFQISTLPIDYTQEFDRSTLPEAVCKVENWSQFRHFYQWDTQGCDYNLQANSDYYIFAAHAEGSSHDHISMGVTVPNFDPAVPNQTPQVQKIQITNNPVRQMISLTLMNATGGTFSLVFQERDNSTGLTTYYKETAAMDHDVDANMLALRIQQKIGVVATAVRVGLTAAQTITGDPAQTKGYKWVVTFSGHRAKDMLPAFKINGLVGARIQTKAVEDRPQSNPVEGNFKIKYGDSDDITVWYWFNGTTMKYHLLRIPELAGGLTVYTTESHFDGYTWYIHMDSVNGAAENITLVENNLEGGTNGKPGIVINPKHQAHSPSQSFMPIPSDFLRTIETFPQITVEVDNMLGGCDGTNCQYTFLASGDTPVLSSFTLSGNDLTIQVANPTGRILSAQDEANIDTISVRFGNSDCSVTSVVWPQINCTMPTNPDGSMQIENGSFVPMVHLKEKGYFKVDAGVTAHDVALTISDINPKEGSDGGGTLLTISGVGFANNSVYGNTNQVTIGNDNPSQRSPCKIVSFNSSEIKCETPAKGTWGSKIFVTTNNQDTDSTLFNFQDSATPKITSLSPNTSSPVLKKDLTINGTGFSSDKSAFKVLLKPEDPTGKEYECNTVSSTDTSITCRLSGGQTGSYRVKVHMTGKGFSMPATTDADLFKYSLTVTSVSPLIGSGGGGTILTITGTNFSTQKSQNQVVIGDTGLDICEILTTTSTELTCRVNAPSEVLNGPQEVKVLGRIQEKAVCLGNCTFTFQNNISPNVTGINPTSASAGTSVSIIGINLNRDPSNTKVIVGGVEATNVSVKSANQITFDMPAIEWGSHQPKVTLGNFGDAIFTETIMVESPLALTSSSPSGGSRGGNVFTLTGNGFKTDKSHMKVILHNTDCEIMTISETEITAKCGLVNSSNPVVFSLEYEDDNSAIQTLYCVTCIYVPTANYPHIKSLSSSGPFDIDNVTFGILGDYLQESADNPPTAYNVSDLKVWLKNVNTDRFGDHLFEGTVSVDQDGVVCSFPNMVAGEYQVEYFIEGVGFARIHSDVPNIVLEPEITDWDSAYSSYLGGREILIEGKGFPDMDQKDAAIITVCNQHCITTESSRNTLKCLTPALATEEVQESLGLLSPEIQRDAVVTGDRELANMNAIIDGDFRTYYQGNGNGECHVQLDFGEFSIIKATKIRLFPRVNHDERDLVGGRLEGSLDGADFTTLATIDENVVENWNTFRPADDEDWKFRYLQFSPEKGNCSIAELEVTGYKFAKIDFFNSGQQDCDGKLSVFGSDAPGNQLMKVKYSMISTPTVKKITPSLGTTVGGTQIRIEGSGFNTTDSMVYIDDIECKVLARSPNTIQCITGARPTFTESKFEVRSQEFGDANTDGNLFLYIDRWSDSNTWGGEAPPREGDSVYVPKGQILLVDVSPPPLYSVIVEGVIMWEDEKDMTFDAWFIMVREGQLKIGSPEKPHMHNLTVTLYGDRESKMLPGFGNKAIMIHNGQIDIHGKPLDTTWTELELAAVPGDKTITLVKDVPDWKVGDQIIIAPTGQDMDEVEERTITSINGKVIGFDEGLEFYHFAGTVNPNDNHLSGGETERVNTIDPPNRDGAITLRAEVGLLTRNVKIQGDEDTMNTGHGVHIMLRGKEGVARGRYSYMEVFRAGQKFQLGRYPIHFHMIGHVVDNYVIGCAVHQTFNRGTIIHGVHYLTLKDNVYYRTMGHTIFLEDGIETNNVIENNLVVHVSVSTSMLLSDLMPSGLWQARPTNYIRENHFVGCAGNGAWFELVHHPTGPSATDSICSISDHLTQYERNVHHSNDVGLRIYPHYFPETHTCKANSNHTLRDPWAENPGIPAEFKDNIMYMNNLGTFGKLLGAVQYQRTTFISNATNQLMFRSDMAKDHMCRVEDSVYIGYSELVEFHKKEDNSPKFTNGLGITLPQTSGLLIKDTRFYNFKHGNVFNLCTSCRLEKKRKAGGAQISWENVQFKNISVNLFSFSDADYDKDIERDIDGSLLKVMMDGIDSSKQSQFANGGWMTAWFPHLDIPECVKQEDPLICNEPCAICDNTINLRRVKTTPVDDMLLLKGQDMKVFNLGKVGDDSNPNGFHPNMNGQPPSEEETETVGRVLSEDNPDDAKFGFNKFRNCKVSLDWQGWLSVLPTGYQYNFHFGDGVEWVKLYHENDYYWGLYREEQAVHLRSNHTESRESYTGVFNGINSDDTYGTIVHEDILKTEFTHEGKFGDFMYDSTEKMITWKIDEKRIGKVENTVVYCTGSNCNEEPESSGIISDTITYWSDASLWPEGRLPTGDDQEVIIEETWNMHYDMNQAKYDELGLTPPNLQHLKIKGRLTMDPTKDVTLNVYNVEIFNGGELIAGSEDTPHTKKATINFMGSKSLPYMNVSADIEPVNKAILNRGLMHMYGVAPNVTWSHLTAKALVGDTKITVAGTSLGWKAGDELVIASSSSKAQEMEKVTISGVRQVGGNSEIEIDESIQFLHYGAAAKTSTPKGEIDMRAEVGNLTRNVKIVSDLTGDWGCTIMTPSWTDLEADALPKQGNLKLVGIEIQNCGQRDSRKAAVNLRWVKQNKGSHMIHKCSFNNGQGWGINLDRAEAVTVSNNVLYNTRRFGMYLGKAMKGIQVNQNLLVGIKDRDNYDNVELYDTPIGIYHDDEEGHWDQDEEESNHVVMKGNSVSSSSWFGFAVPAVNCNDKPKEDLHFTDNIAHSNRAGWIPMRLKDQNCALFSHFHAYKNWGQGVLHRAEIPFVEAENLILADNRNGLALNAGNGVKYPSIKFTDSAIIGKVLLDCPECYKGDDCETTGLITGLFNKPKYEFYWEEVKLPMHNSTSAKFTYGGTQDISDVHFINFAQSDECPDTRQTAIRMNNFYQDDGTMVTFSNITLTNVDDKNKLYFPNHKRHLDSGAYCNRVDCTANYNNLFVDLDGDIMDTAGPMHFFGNNKGAGRDGDCSFKEDWNGHACNPEYAQLLLTRENDDRGLNIFPLNLKIEEYSEDKSDDLKFLVESNGETDVYSLIKRNKQTFVQTSQTMPSGLTYELHSPVNSDYVVIKVQSENPATMNLFFRNPRTQQGKNWKRPIVLKPGEELDMHSHKTDCGANKYDHKNRILLFVVTANNCEVTVDFTNSLQLSTHLNIDPEQFFASNGATNFIDRMAALLEISTDRIKIVDVRKGSTILVTDIMSANNVVSDRNDKDTVVKELEGFKAKIEKAVADEELDLGAPILDVNSEFAIDNVEPADDGTDTEEPSPPAEENDQKTRNILLGIFIPLIVIGIGVGVFFLVRHLKNKKKGQPKTESKPQVSTTSITSSRANIPKI